MTAPEIIRVLYRQQPAPANARRDVDRLCREFSASYVLGLAKQTACELPAPAAHDGTPVRYLDALCRVEAARERRRAEA